MGVNIVEPDPDFPKGPPRPSPSPVFSTTPTATDIISNITRSMATSSPTPTSKSHGFDDITSGGTSGEKIMRGFFIGMALGVVLSLVLCCWLPCLRKSPRTRLQRRNDNIRRRLVILEDEAWVNQNWPQRRPWEVGQDERGSYESHDVSHEEV
ncbi:hypothetical protein HDV63DRAFT_390659 [Trichoderma sp. SZMC 28014]